MWSFSSLFPSNRFGPPKSEVKWIVQLYLNLAKTKQNQQKTRSNECKKNYYWDKIKMEFYKWFMHPNSEQVLWKKFIICIL